LYDRDIGFDNRTGDGWSALVNFERIGDFVLVATTSHNIDMRWLLQQSLMAECFDR
jgi:hypothetical protein